MRHATIARAARVVEGHHGDEEPVDHRGRLTMDGRVVHTSARDRTIACRVPRTTTGMHVDTPSKRSSCVRLNIGSNIALGLQYSMQYCIFIGNIGSAIALGLKYCTHIQHTRASKYPYLSAVVPPSSAAALLSPAAPFTGVDPNIHECNRTTCT